MDNNISSIEEYLKSKNVFYNSNKLPCSETATAMEASFIKLRINARKENGYSWK